MWDYLQNLSFWDWLAFGSVLLILEVFGVGGYLLWTGLAAAIVGALLYLFPELPWAWQLLLSRPPHLSRPLSLPPSLPPPLSCSVICTTGRF